MKKFYRITIVLGIATFLTESAGAQSFLLDLYSETNPVIGSTTFPTGERAFLINTDNGRMLWRGTSTGAPMWTNQVPSGTGQMTLEVGSNGGLYLVNAHYTMTTSGSVSFNDTLVEYLSVKSLLDDGTENWSKELELVSIFPYETHVYNQDLTTAAMPDGGLLVALKYDGQTFADVLHIFNFAPDGELLFAKAYGTQLFPDFPIGMFVDGLYDVEELKWTVSADGRFYLTCKRDVSPQPTFLFGFDPDGNLEWVKRVEYENAWGPSLSSNPITLGSGDLLFGMHGFIASSHALVTVRTSNTGDFVEADLYTSANSMADPWLIAEGSDQHWFKLGANGVMLNDADGSVAEAWQAPLRTVPPFTFATSIASITPLAGSLSVNLVLNRTHQVFGYQDRFVGGTAIAIADPGCLFEPMDIMHYDLPDSLLTVDTMQTPQTFDLTPVITAGVPLADATSLGNLDLCSQLVGIPEVSFSGFSLINSVAGAGTPIAICTDRALRFDLVTVSGQQVMHSSVATPAGLRYINVDSWPPGVYVLRAFEAAGTPSGTAKVFVESSR